MTLRLCDLRTTHSGRNTQLAGHAVTLAADPAAKAEALAVLASLAFLKGNVPQAVEWQTQALRELPDNSVLQKRLAAYQAAL